ncbi:hypothetical protein F511_44684 [Dorcoceras hygrometricum]|uniref:HTH cro/C1-type domain-containing protein n=1 Tax=Dorcoceras hygrometricum TaxID=472368 RepID=A0A2Z6ZXN8_9LAMI|nr:hypothetical protein F511_44684 [Dorcoceras hygrometricum]
MSSPDRNLVSRVAESIDYSSPPETSHREDEIPSLAELHRARILRIDQDEARLAAQGCTWYEIKASTLRESDISSIKDKAGLSNLYEVIVPRIDARANHPPVGFHTFYVNQIERGLRFPIPKFITTLCDHLEVSPSQLTPNSFRSLLSLGILLKFHSIPLSTYTLSRENFWGCDMSWRDDAHTLSPSTPEQKPDLTRFLEVIGGRCFNAQQLIEEDLLCFFNFSGKKARLVGDLDDRMTKAEMMEALKEMKAKSKGASSSRTPSKEKWKEPSERKERHKKRRNEEMGTESARVTVPKDPSEEQDGRTNKDPEHQSTEEPYILLDTSAISFVSSPSGPVSLDFIRRLIPDRDFDQVKRTPDLKVLETAGLHFMQSLVWFGEAASRFSKARGEVIMTRRSMDGVLGRHDVLMKQLEEIQTKKNVEKESLSVELESARTEVQALRAQALADMSDDEDLDDSSSGREEASPA